MADGVRPLGAGRLSADDMDGVLDEGQSSGMQVFTSPTVALCG